MTTAQLMWSGVTKRLILEYLDRISDHESNAILPPEAEAGAASLVILNLTSLPMSADVRNILFTPCFVCKGSQL